jgi:hypothetical protein
MVDRNPEATPGRCKCRCTRTEPLQRSKRMLTPISAVPCIGSLRELRTFGLRGPSKLLNARMWYADRQRSNDREYAS